MQLLHRRFIVLALLSSQQLDRALLINWSKKTTLLSGVCPSVGWDLNSKLCDVCVCYRVSRTFVLYDDGIKIYFSDELPTQWTLYQYESFFSFLMHVSGWRFLLVPAHPGSPGQTAIKRLCVCLFSALVLFLNDMQVIWLLKMSCKSLISIINVLCMGATAENLCYP